MSHERRALVARDLCPCDRYRLLAHSSVTRFGGPDVAEKAI